MTWEALEPVLQATGYEYARQGSYADAGELPSTFITFWNLDTPTASHYDNEPNRAIWRWQVYLYTKNPAIMYTAMQDLLAAAKQAGFVLEGMAWDIDADEPGYVGRTARLAYCETL